jgi:hypothetical protein
MGRIRTIKPEFWRNEALSELPEFAHMLAAALLNYADDEGYFNANPKLVVAECFPLREPSMDTTVALRELSRIGYIRLGEGSDGRTYGHVVAFRKHQTINKPTKSKIAVISIAWDGDNGATVGLPEDYPTERGTGNGEKEDSDANASDGDAVDFAKAVFDRGVSFLVRHGQKERDARSVIGRWRKDHPDREIFDAFSACSKAGAVDPIPWITARLTPRAPVTVSFDLSKFEASA